ncbi:MAG: RnfABCDGE type electron transport complex subunit B [Fluviicoccus sp.]|uniref:RnfABCDGE type electron transport complex subunit B n=1 Tax=Fluviicoccus sp. TaxID=2003552 RepID=UPI00271AC6F9|nr:RnfABCDGE type electron transport complex subunit B [Fluviicoccus sp.]MDO8329457.1 RnfABCDGE type electron transport complex subunit B [Fluviicoccus sp.]
MLLATLILTGLGLMFGVLLGISARVFAVPDENPLVKEIEALMPGAQCGQCGFPGCSAAAEALVNGEAKITCCPPGGRGLAEQLATLLGVPMEADDRLSVPMIARINADDCTGCTRCFRACPTDAIVGANGQIHVVMSAACTGCNQCAEACPEQCVTLHPELPSLESWSWPKPLAA